MNKREPNMEPWGKDNIRDSGVYGNIRENRVRVKVRVRIKVRVMFRVRVRVRARFKVRVRFKIYGYSRILPYTPESRILYQASVRPLLLRTEVKHCRYTVKV